MKEADVSVIVNGKSDTYKLTDEEAKFKFISSLQSGVWYINTLHNGYVATIIADHIADMPAVMTKVSFEQRRQRVAKCVSALLLRKRQMDKMPTTREVLNAVVKGL